MPLTSVCRQHARLGRVGDQFVIEDLNSRGGTWVNGRQICDFLAVFEAERHSAKWQTGQGQA